MNEANVLETLWGELHKRAEVSLKEFKTTTYLINYFKEMDLHPVTFKNIPGFYVDVGIGHPVVGLRADMDALMQEVNGELRANHSCGHDAHMTIITGVMSRLQTQATKLNGTVRAIFQPAEELGNGSIDVVKEGVIDELDYLFGVHLRPQNELPFPKCAPGIQHGACAFIKGKIHGRDHHGSRQNEGVNAIEVGSAIIQQLQHIHTAPFIPSSVKMTNFHAGTDNLNIIPGHATFGIDLRSQSNDVMDDMKEKITNAIKHIAAIYNVHIETEVIDDVPAAIINQEAEQLLNDALIKVIGAENIHPTIQTSGSDDFHFYTLLKPQIKATMLALGANLTPSLHDPYMTFDKRALLKGVAILEQVCVTICK